ncbi:hypothetical protein C0033_09020 [Clostridium sp. chh4-2]|uniref:hypothetical protein n=1 Tax=Clostridium sp. chh4-2 TaxID=2067550 RepID=UPI000CCDD9D4|nr:hypothetical protein [Clostridium sp. chh4-2]PNV62244.1 hypothetical protein C0033_09020 [Clostridium sp. chh4-2]
MSKNIYVVYIHDDYKLSLNVGKNDGINLNNRFLIYTLSDHEIIDPATKESLGYLELVKGTGKVIHVQDNMCTIESDKYENSLPRKIIRKNSPSFIINPLLEGPVEETIIEKEHIPFDNPEVGDLAKLF